MPLTASQKTSLKAHLAANTNTITNGTGQVLAINAVVGDVGDNFQHVADWYNAIALSGDNQPIAAPLLVWRPMVMIQQLNSAIVWSAQPAGADTASITNAWLKWQSMCWNNQIDMTDGQVRQGISDVWGSGSATDTAVKAKGCGRQDGTRLEVLLAAAGVGGGRVSQVFGYRVNGPEIVDAILNG